MDNIPPSYLCSITHQLMENPVIDREGNSYEEKAILEWLETSQTSPITRNFLEPGHLTVNRAVRDAIEEFKLTTPPSTPTPNPTPNPTSNPTPCPKDHPVQIAIKRIATEDNTDIHISVIPPNNHTVDHRNPVDIYACIDTSYSMEDEVVQKKGGKEERNGQCILDLVKHAMKSVVSGLSDCDRLTLVPYSSSANIDPLCRQLPMTPDNKKIATQRIKSLHPNGSTNIWDSLLKSLDLIRENKSPRGSFILLLTDGVPNISPPRGETESLKKYLDTYPDLDLSIYCFGFGYNLETEKLRDIARIGNGQYNFIPDASLLGSILINATANILSYMTVSAKLSIETSATQYSLIGYEADQYHQTSWGLEYNLGQINYGQNRDFVFRITEPVGDTPSITARVSYLDNTGDMCDVVQDHVEWEDTREITLPSDDPSWNALNRLIFVEKINQTTNLLKITTTETLDNANSVIARYENDLDNSAYVPEMLTSKFILAIHEDLVGQVMPALSKKEWWNRWGRHYLPSIAGAYQSQVCNNFMDKGVQFFGGELFKTIQSKLEELFIKIPMDPGYLSARHINTGGSNYTTPSASSYLNRYGGCFHGSCQVLMADGSYKTVKTIKRGDLVMTYNKQSAKVLGVMVTRFPAGKTDLVKIGKLLISPYHPVLFDNHWTFPKDIAKPHTQECQEVYTFVIEKCHILLINSVPCVCLGHNIRGPVIGHDYFGTNRIVQDLARFPSWDKTGVVEVTSDQFSRDPATGRVDGITGTPIDTRQVTHTSDTC